MATWAANRKNGLMPGTIGITITVIEYDAGTKSYHPVSSTTYRPAGVPLPTASYRRLESVPVSPVRPFALAAMTERKPYRGTRRRSSAGNGDER
ncbi:hypothetical protein ABIA35_007659 [Catenulispora sp. MAP12-49]|uniref:hypothetical protein n=1 Tax=Catenulispora sp. MAP12-49 TaxID=3156302 RepID=UPI003515DA24